MIKFEPIIDSSNDVKPSPVLLFSGSAPSPRLQSVLDLYYSVLSDHDSLAISMMVPNGSVFANRARANDKVIYPLSDFSRSLLRRAPQLWPILTSMRRFRYDIAITHDGYAVRGLKQIASRVIGICHDDHFEAFRGADDIITFSSSTADAAELFYGCDTIDGSSEIHCAPLPYMCLNSKIKELVPDQPVTVGAWGDMTQESGLGHFIHVAQLVKQALPDVRFVIGGSGPLEHELKELSDQIAPFIDFVGPVHAEEMSDLIDIYCHTRSDDGLGLELATMMDAGVACISSYTHGPLDILRGGMVAPLVAVDDALGMAERVIDLISDHDKLLTNKTKCYQRIREEDFSLTSFAQRLEEIIRA